MRRALLLVLVLSTAITVGLGLSRTSPAHALTAGPLAPQAQGQDSAWVANSGTQLNAINQTSCGAADGSWITATYRGSTSFVVSLSTVPNFHRVTAISLTVCYADNDNLDNMESIRPFVRVPGSADQVGAVIDANGSTNLRVQTQTFPTSIDKVFSQASIEVGVTDFGFLAQSTTRVYAIWAAVEYVPLPLPEIRVTSLPLEGSSEPYEPMDEFVWQATMVVPEFWFGGVAVRLDVAWDPAQVSGVFLRRSSDCFLSPAGGWCRFPSGEWLPPFTFPLGMTVAAGARTCSATLSVTASLLFPTPLQVQTSNTVAIAAPGCGTPSSTPSAPPGSSPTATLSATSTPPATTTTTPGPTTSTPSATWTPTALPTFTPTTPSTATPNTVVPGTRTPTRTPTPGATQLPFTLRTILLANDGGH